MQIATILWFIIGLTFLVGGAELLVRGASKIAIVLGISPVIVGLTIVAFGTSAPELAVTLQANYDGKADVAIGNIIGSNIANILLILGICGAIFPLSVVKRLIKIDIPIVIIASVVFYLFALDSKISHWEGGIFFIAAVLYTYLVIKQTRNGKKKKTMTENPEEQTKDRSHTNIYILNGVYITVGLLFLVKGADLLIESAIKIAVNFGISELVAGLTIVAIGTSLPEVATSLVATMKGEKDIAIGNAVGSNLFNILLVAGLGSLFSSQGLPVKSAALAFDIPFMLAVAFALLPIAFTGFKIVRWEGILFLVYYIAYMVYLVLESNNHENLQQFTAITFLYAGPLILITLFLLSVKPGLDHLKKRR